jgi:DNA-directed RNA polymerase specialized sigma24 family protein
MALMRPTPVTSEDQYAEFVNARASALLRTAILLTAGDRATAENLVQTALVRTYAKRRRIGTPEATEADARRSLVRAATRGRDSGGRQVDDGAASRGTILDAIRPLPSRQRATIVLRYYDDYSEPQVAAALGCSAATARRHTTRALETLRRQWAEDQLRDRLAAAVDPVRADPELIARVIEESGSARRQRRRSRLLTGCAAALIALVGGSLVYFDGSGDHSPPGPDQPGLVQVDPIAWARQLPQGPPIRLAYLTGMASHVPGRRAPLPRGAGLPIGKTPEGWLVTVYPHGPHKGGLSAWLRYGLVTAKGTIELLPRDPYHGSIGVRALSPDGRLFAMGGALIDIAQRRVIGRTPPDAFYSTGWTSVGLLYSSRQRASARLWRPGSAPVRLPDPVWAGAATAPIGLVAAGEDCLNVVHLDAGGDTTPLYDGCAAGATSPVSLSPDGTHALTDDLDMLDVAEGNVTPWELPTNGTGQPGWEDNDHFVLPVESSETTGRDRVVFVRCSIAAHSCERAGPEFTKAAWDEVLVG